MQRRRALLVDAFTTEPFAGNPAGVIPKSDGLGADQMQTIAAELGASETAFLSSSAEADRQIRFFTPTTEVDLCGHATIASLAYLSQVGSFDPGTYSFETNVGVLPVEIGTDGRCWMEQAAPEIHAVETSIEEVADILGVEERAIEDVGEDLPLAVASTGFPFLMVPMAYLEDLGAAEPDFEGIESLGEEIDADGIYAFTFDTLDRQSDVHGRAFVPGAGIDEDPVTGTACGAAGAYLREYEAFEVIPDELWFEQGHYVDRPGHVVVKVGEQIEVGGRAAVTLDGEIAQPVIEDDDIIEV